MLHNWLDVGRCKLAVKNNQKSIQYKFYIVSSILNKQYDIMMRKLEMMVVYRCQELLLEKD